MADNVAGTILDPAAQEEFARQMAARRAAVAAPASLQTTGMPPVATGTQPAPATQTVQAVPRMPAVGGQPVPLPPVQTPEDRRVNTAEKNVEHVEASKPATTKLMEMSKDIGSDPNSFMGRHPGLARFVRPLAEVGSGVLRGVETAGNIAAPGIMMNIPGTEFNRAARLTGAESQLGQAEKNRTEAAQSTNLQAEAEKNKALATQSGANQKLTADMAAKGYSPVTDAQGKTSWQFTGKGEEKIITDDRKTLENGQPNENFGKSVYANLDPSGKPLAYGALAAEANKPLTAQQTPIGAAGVTGYTAQVHDLPNLTPAQQKNYAPKATDTAEQAEKKLADARDLDARLAQGKEQANRKAETDLKMVQGEKDKAHAEFNKVLTTDSDKLMNLQSATNMTTDPNGIKDAFTVVKSLVATTGGLGSGVRITNAELDRIAHARGWAQSVDVMFNNALDPKKFETLSPDQRTQLLGVIQDVRKEVATKQAIYSWADNQVLGAANVQQVNEIKKQANTYMRALEKGTAYTDSDVNWYAEHYYHGDVAKAEERMKKDGLTVKVPE